MYKQTYLFDIYVTRSAKTDHLAKCTLEIWALERGHVVPDPNFLNYQRVGRLSM